MGNFYLNFLGRFGNQMFQYAFAKGYCEKHGLTLHTDHWLGQKVFDLYDPPIPPGDYPQRNENNLQGEESDVVFRSYCQQQKCLIYSRRDCLRWFKLRHGLERVLLTREYPKVVGHRRVGDYAGYGYPVVSELSYIRHTPSVELLTEENPLRVDGIPEHGCIPFLPDFYCMMTADVLLRGNSTFSWWAATLNERGSIYSPIIAGLEGGREHDCKFVEGNWPRFANLEFTTDLHLRKT